MQTDYSQVKPLFSGPILTKLCEMLCPHLKQEHSLRSKVLHRMGCLAHRSHCPLPQPGVISWPRPCVVRQPLVAGGLAFLIPKSGETKEQIHRGTEMIIPDEMINLPTVTGNDCGVVLPTSCHAAQRSICYTLEKV